MHKYFPKKTKIKRLVWLAVFLGGITVSWLVNFSTSPALTVQAQENQPPTQTDEAVIVNHEADEVSIPVAAPVVPSPPTQPINLTLSPITLNLSTDPGQSVTSTIKIMNNGLEDEYLELELQKFTADETGAKPVVVDFEPGEVSQEWVSFNPQQLVVKPKEWQTVEVKFNPPDTAALTYYYAILVKRQVESEAQEATVVSGVPAILMLTNVHSPHARFELQLTQFLTKHRVYEFLPTEFEVKIKNSGNTHIAPLGNIFINQGQRKDVATLSLNQESGLILPGFERTFTVKWTEGFPAYEELIDPENQTKSKRRRLHWKLSQINHIRIGRYIAHLVFIYDNGERDIPVESQLTFWVIPWRLLIAGGVVLGLIISGLINPISFVFKALGKRSKKKRKARRN